MESWRRYHKSKTFVDKARPMSITDLPQPKRGRHDPADPKVCFWCHEAFPPNAKCAQHTRCCKKMSHDNWLYRTQFLMQDSEEGDFPGPHCGTRFPLAKAKGRWIHELGMLALLVVFWCHGSGSSGDAELLNQLLRSHLLQEAVSGLLESYHAKQREVQLSPEQRRRGEAAKPHEWGPRKVFLFAAVVDRLMQQYGDGAMKTALEYFKEMAEPELPALDWEGLAQVHSDEDLDTLHQLRADLNAMWEQIRQSTDEQVTQDLKRQHKLLNRSMQRFRVQARGRFVRSICKEAEEHMHFHDLGKFYQSLKKLGVHLDGHTLEGKVTHGLADARKHCKSIGSNLVPVAESMLDSVPRGEVAHWLGATPTDSEIGDDGMQFSVNQGAQFDLRRCLQTTGPSTMYLNLLTVLFADDTTGITRASSPEGFEQDMATALGDFVETLHAGKTHRLKAGFAPPANRLLKQWHNTWMKKEAGYEWKNKHSADGLTAARRAAVLCFSLLGSTFVRIPNVVFKWNCGLSDCTFLLVRSSRKVLVAREQFKGNSVNTEQLRVPTHKFVDDRQPPLKQHKSRTGLRRFLRYPVRVRRLRRKQARPADFPRPPEEVWPQRWIDQERDYQNTKADVHHRSACSDVAELTLPIPRRASGVWAPSRTTPSAPSICDAALP
ncbi:unnamed protein product [Symbiodinium necroappetens]|uniref:Uncharacterized protein n=1 Tax=Symbiodinium necroappetens TaxID=1628268 RepID=A0A812PLN4_9DINO|nr:unnamed protein product [Symbiodinium necroappetens]